MTSTTNSPMILAEVAFDASTIGDPDGTRTVIAIIALLVVIGLALIMIAFWMRRVTRPDPEFLAPLELMGERSWRRGDPVWQRRKLDEVRPDDAVPLKRSVAPPRLDESFDAGPSATGFDDLRQDEDAPESAAPEGDGAVVVGSTSAAAPEIDDDSTRPTASPEWPPRPPAVDVPGVGDGNGGHEDDVGATEEGDGAADGRGEGRDGDHEPLTPQVVGVSVGAEVVGEAADGDHGERDDDAGEHDVDPDGSAADGVGDDGEHDVDPDGSAADGVGDDGEHDVDPDGSAADGVDEDDDPTPTPIASNRPLDDFPDHEFDPAELQRAMAELDEELRHGRDDE